MGVNVNVFDESCLIPDEDDGILHYGTPRHSGRYPWGSGGDDVARSKSFLGYVEELKGKGMSEVEIARAMDMKVSELRNQRSIAKNAALASTISEVVRLGEKGMSNVAIGQRLRIPESTVRSLRKQSLTAKTDVLNSTANLLKDKLSTGGYLDVGVGSESHLNISSTKLAAAVSILKNQGYVVRNIQMPQQFGKGKTTYKVLGPPGSEKTYIDPAQIKTVAAYSENGGKSYKDIEPPVNVSSSRIGINYADQGGANADGVIYIRPGVPDVSLGGSRYAQVRIAVDGTHYLKGMAMYKADLPAGKDLVFNTNKSDTGNKLDALKPQKDEQNPFGATIRQMHYKGEDGKMHLSPMNIVNKEGNWADWSRTLSSQVLSKQSSVLAKRQLDLALANRKDDLSEIMRLTNPVVKHSLLSSYADSADYAAVHLKAAALPSQGTHVILPIPSLKEGEIYAPNYTNGQRVALIRFPHGGTFEIPELTVNNRNTDARKSIGTNAPDAVGIHPKVAERLSGADFDGDHVLVIPNGRGELKTSPPLKDLEHFDPKIEYAPYDGMRTIDGGIYHAATHSVDYGGKQPSGRAKQQQMGDVSNLITDMTIKGAKPAEIARAVRHSMVVIDAEKHNLNYRQSRIDNGIDALKRDYQGISDKGRLAGASTIISRASSEIRVPQRRLRSAAEGGPIDRATGRPVYVNTGKEFVDRHGKTVRLTTASTKLGEAANARALISRASMPIEHVYADHSNELKALANEARKASLTTGSMKYSPSAAKTYASEVSRLNSALKEALYNKPLERQAQLIANTIERATRASNPHLDPADLKKLKVRALDTGRLRVGAQKYQIEISPREWEAIQAGAISSKRLRDILEHTNIKEIRKLATPRTAPVMTPSKLAIAKARIDAGYTQAEVAASLGVPVSTLNAALRR
jgi:DNA-binding CsgD family transcriptional regulator